jgi:hypothetical protein
VIIREIRDVERVGRDCRCACPTHLPRVPLRPMALETIDEPGDHDPVVSNNSVETDDTARAEQWVTLRVFGSKKAAPEL